MIITTRKNNGLSVIELLIGIVITVIIITSVYYAFISGIRLTLKGQDTMDSTRAAAKLFRLIRNDMLACKKIDTGNAAQFIDAGENFDEDKLIYANTVCFDNDTNRIVYAFEQNKQAQNGYITRKLYKNNNLQSVKKIGIPRIKSIEITQIWKRQIIASGMLNNFLSGLLYVRLIINSDDARIPTKSLNLSSFFVFTQMIPTNWNYFMQK